MRKVARVAFLLLLAVLASRPALSEEFPTKLECPSETVLRSSEDGLKTWCEDEDGTKNGPFLNYRENGESIQTGHYVNGTLHGKITLRGYTCCIQHRWYGISGVVKDDTSGVCPEGSTLIDEGRLGWHNVRREGCYRRAPKGDALRHGPRTGWIIPGKDKQERRLYQANYLDGTKHGLVRDWHSSGELRYEGSKRFGKSHGVARTWNESGQIIQEISFENGVRHGRSRYWEYDGTLRWSATYENGNMVTFEGDRTVEGRACPDDAVLVGHRPPHGLSIKCVRFEDDSKAIRHGPSTRWHSSGKKREEEEFRHDKTIGVWRYWREDSPPGSEGSTAVFVTEPEDQVLSARGVVRYYGDLVHKVTEQKLSFSFRDEEDRSTTYVPRIVIEESRFEIFGLPPGLYSMKTTTRIQDSSGEAQLIGERRKLRINEGEVATLRVKLKTSDVTKARIRGAILLGITLFMPILFAGVLTPIAFRFWSPSPRRAGWWGMFLAVGTAAPLLVFHEDPPEKVIIWVVFSVLM